MKNVKKISALLLVTAFTLQGCATQQPKKPVSAVPTKVVAPQATAQPAPANPVVEPYALERLKQMSDTLTSSKAFTYYSNSAIELQAENGQFVTFFTNAEVSLQRPNKLYMDVSGDVPDLKLYFDGNKVSVIDTTNNIYAVSTPLTNIDEMLEFIMAKAQISFPSADIMYSNPYAVMTKNLTAATLVSDSIVNGVHTEHFAYREPAIDWEIWISKDETPLPMRLAMTYKQVENRPSFLVEFAGWKLNPKLKAKTFEFKAPADGKQIEFGTYLNQKK